MGSGGFLGQPLTNAFWKYISFRTYTSLRIAVGCYSRTTFVHGFRMWKALLLRVPDRIAKSQRRRGIRVCEFCTLFILLLWWDLGGYISSLFPWIWKISVSRHKLFRAEDKGKLTVILMFQVEQAWPTNRWRHLPMRQYTRLLRGQEVLLIHYDLLLANKRERIVKSR